AAVLIPLTNWHWLDAAVSAGAAIFIIPRAIGLLRQSAPILLEGSPGEIDGARDRGKLLRPPAGEHRPDRHFWTLTSERHAADVHSRASQDRTLEDVLAAVRNLLREKAGVDHATIQIEQGEEMSCHASSRGHE